MTSRHLRIALQALALSLLLLLALAVRLVGSDELFDGPRTRLVDAESHLQAWRTVQAMDSFPAPPPATVEQIAPPEGVVPDAPPGLAYLAGALARLAGLPMESERPGRLATLLVTLLGALCVVLAARLAWRYVDLRWALLAGVLLALWPVHVELGHVGRVSHRTAEALATLAALLLYLGASDGGRWVRRAVGCGLAAGAIVWFSPTPLIPLGLLGLVMLLHGRRPAPAAVALGVALALAAPLCLAPPYLQRWSLLGPSPAQLLALGLVLVLVLGAAAARRWVDRGWLRATGIVGLALAGLPALPWRSVHEHLARVAAAPWEHPLHRLPLWELPTDESLILLCYLGAALPLLVALALAARLERRHEVQLLALVAGILVVLGTWRVGLLPLALSVFAPLCGIGLAEASHRASGWLRGRARPALVRTVGPLLGLGTLCLLWPAADYLADGERRRMSAPGGVDTEQAARWLRQRTAGQRPVVLAAPQLGTLLVNLGRVRVLAAPMHDPATTAANRRALGLLIERKRAGRHAKVKRLGVDWILVRRLSTPGHTCILRHFGRNAGSQEVFRFHRRTLAVRLFHDLGSGAKLTGDYLPALGYVYHAWESDPRIETPPTHLFHVVPGARLVGTATPWDIIDLELRLVSNRGRPMTFLDRVRADGRGHFALRVPYWSGRRVPVQVRRYLAALARLRARIARGERGLRPVPFLNRPTFTPMGLVRVTAGAKSADVHVPRQAVLSGATITVHLAR